MILFDVKTDNTTDYKKTSILLAFPYCSGKCKGCQNEHLQKQNPRVFVEPNEINELYLSLRTHFAVVMAGLEPFDSFSDVKAIVKTLLNGEKPIDIVIYTGYNNDEYEQLFEPDLLYILKSAKNKDIDKKLIVKIGRYEFDNPNSWFSETLGVKIATDNQFVKVYNIDGTGYIERKK